MVALLILTFAGGWLLLLAGVAKIGRPAGSVAAIRTLTGARSPSRSARALGAGEVVIAVWHLTNPNWLSATALGVWYAALLVIALRLRRQDVDCGCFGAHETPVSRGHLVVTLVLTIASLVAVPLLSTDPLASYPAQLVAASIPSALGLYAALVPLPSLSIAIEGIRE